MRGISRLLALLLVLATLGLPALAKGAEVKIDDWDPVYDNDRNQLNIWFIRGRIQGQKGYAGPRFLLSCTGVSEVVIKPRQWIELIEVFTLTSVALPTAPEDEREIAEISYNTQYTISVGTQGPSVAYMRISHKGKEAVARFSDFRLKTFREYLRRVDGMR